MLGAEDGNRALQFFQKRQQDRPHPFAIVPVDGRQPVCTSIQTAPEFIGHIEIPGGKSLARMSKTDDGCLQVIGQGRW